MSWRIARRVLAAVAVLFNLILGSVLRSHTFLRSSTPEKVRVV